MPYADPDAKRAYDAARYLGSRDVVKARVRVYAEANKAAVSRRAKAYREKHRAHLAAKDRVRYAGNRARRNAMNREWRRAHPESRALHVRTWKNSHPEKNREYKHRREARLRGAVQIERFTKTEIYERDRWICGICRCPVLRGEESIDHVVPVSRGGQHTRDNVRLAHRLCNNRRGNRG